MADRPSHRIIPTGIPFAQLPHACNLDPDVTNSAFRVYGFLMKLANTEGRAWPGHRYIADHLPMSRNTVATAIGNLEDTGWITVNRDAQAHTYIVHGTLPERLDLDYTNRRNSSAGADIEPAQKLDRTGAETKPQPAQELSHTDTQDRQPNTDTHLAPRRRDPIWDTLVELFGPPSPTRTSLYGRVNKYLHRENATADTIRERAAWITTNWGPEKLTITSLENHWSRFDGQAGQVTDTDVREHKRRMEREEARAVIAAGPAPMSDAQRIAKERTG